MAGDNAAGKGAVKVDIKCGTSFEPVNVYKMLQAIDFEAFKVRSRPVGFTVVIFVTSSNSVM